MTVHPSCFREMSTAPPSLRDGLSAVSCAKSALIASMSAVSAATCGPSRPRVGTKQELEAAQPLWPLAQRSI